MQGVFFRSFVTREARSLKLKGYVRNLPDGTVEVRAEGERELLDELLTLLQKGPPDARVTSVASEWSAPTGDYRDFNTRP